MQQGFVIKQWSVYPFIEASGDSESLTQKQLLEVIPKMLKRRLSPLAKHVFSAILSCEGENNTVPIIFSSTHGELSKSFKMMEQIEAGEEISPTTFSLSVHNAIARLYSIAFNNHCQTSVVAPGEEGIAAAFIEALGLLTEGEKEVLLVFYDEPLEEFYPSKPYRLSTEQTQAVALRLVLSGQGVPVRFSYLPETGDEGEQPVQLDLLIRFLQQEDSCLILKTPRHSWCWEKLA